MEQNRNEGRRNNGSWISAWKAARTEKLKEGGLLIDIDWVGRACGPGFESSGLVGGSVQALAALQL